MVCCVSGDPSLGACYPQVLSLRDILHHPQLREETNYQGRPVSSVEGCLPNMASSPRDPLVMGLNISPFNQV